MHTYIRMCYVHIHIDMFGLLVGIVMDCILVEGGASALNPWSNMLVEPLFVVIEVPTYFHACHYGAAPE